MSVGSFLLEKSSSIVNHRRAGTSSLRSSSSSTASSVILRCSSWSSGAPARRPICITWWSTCSSAPPTISEETSCSGARGRFRYHHRHAHLLVFFFSIFGTMFPKKNKKILFLFWIVKCSFGLQNLFVKIDLKRVKMFYLVWPPGSCFRLCCCSWQS